MNFDKFLWVVFFIAIVGIIIYIALPKLKGIFAAYQIPEEAYYLQASREIKNDVINEGLWTKAWADAHGNDTQAKALYLKYRVSALRTQAAAKFTELSERESAPISKAIVECPRCAQKLRVDANKQLNILCSKCGERFEART